MPRSDENANALPLVYSAPARLLHWSVALLVLVTAPIGFVMVDRSDVKFADGDPTKAAFEAVTNTMYDWHKVIGITILALMVARLAYRLLHGAPRSEPTLAGWEKGLSHVVHWSIYALLFALPISGYLGISYGDYLNTFGVKLPGLVALHDGDNHEKISEQIFNLHKIGAIVVLTLVGLHIAAVLYHRFVRGDGVLSRMWPGRSTG